MVLSQGIQSTMNRKTKVDKVRLQMIDRIVELVGIPHIFITTHSKASVSCVD